MMHAYSGPPLSVTRLTREWGRPESCNSPGDLTIQLEMRDIRPSSWRRYIIDQGPIHIRNPVGRGDRWRFGDRATSRGPERSSPREDTSHDSLRDKYSEERSAPISPGLNYNGLLLIRSSGRFAGAGSYCCHCQSWASRLVTRGCSMFFCDCGLLIRKEDEPW